MMHLSIGGTHSRIRWPWLGVGGPGASTKTLDHAWNAPVLSPHPKTPRSQVANLAEIKPKSGAREWSRVWCTAVRRTPHTNKWPCSVPRVQGHAGKPVPTCVLPPWPAQPPSRAMGKANFRDGRSANLRSLILHGTVHHAVGETHSPLTDARHRLQVGDPGASTNNPPSRVESLPVPLPHPQNSSLGSGKFGGNQAKIGRPGVVKGVVHGRTEDPTHRQMALQRPQGPGARRQTRPNMCTAAMAGPTTFPCHGEGELPGRPVSQSQVTDRCTVRCTMRWERPTARLQRPP